MGLDSATTAFLELLRGMGGKPLYELTIEEARAVVRASSLQLAPPATDVHTVLDRQITAPGRDVGIRIYTPRAAQPGESLPVLLHFHGAGFVAGDLDTHDSIARFYCRHADAIVISVDYRLAPEHPFPSAVEDSYSALEWAAQHAHEIGGDAGRIAVCGDSAGGNLSAVVCLLSKTRRGPGIAFQALVYPTVDLRLVAEDGSRVRFGGGEFFLSNRDMEFFRSRYLTDVEGQMSDPRASPLLASDLTGLPPAVIITAGCDPLLDEGKAYADRLAAAGVPVEYRCFEQTIHAFVSFAGAIPVGLEALSFVASRIRAALHPAGVS